MFARERMYASRNFFDRRSPYWSDRNSIKNSSHVPAKAQRSGAEAKTTGKTTYLFAQDLPLARKRILMKTEREREREWERENEKMREWESARFGRMKKSEREINRDFFFSPWRNGEVRNAKEKKASYRVLLSSISTVCQWKKKKKKKETFLFRV